MLIISYDAVGDSEIDRLMEYPAFSAFYRQAAAFRDVSTVFVSNTYPIHASVATGVPPREHGLISNTEPFPKKHPVWNTRDSRIRVNTLWQAAAKQGIETAAVFWPVTAYSKTIRWNIPEVLARPGKSQLMASLSAGSKILQLKMLLRYRKLLGDASQPSRDYFGSACMAYILRKHSPGLALMHLTAYDSLCHLYGKDDGKLDVALTSLDRNLALLLEAAGEERDVLLFSDHSQINVNTNVFINDILVDAGLLQRKEGSYLPGESECFVECCGGSAFFHAGSLAQSRIDELRATIEQSEGFGRFLTDDEMSCSGYDFATFGFCPLPGYAYSAYKSEEKAQHGYPPDIPGYNVFYLARGFGLEPGSATLGGSLLDIAPLAAKRLGVEMF